MGLIVVYKIILCVTLELYSIIIQIKSSSYPFLDSRQPLLSVNFELGYQSFTHKTFLKEST